jgi:hypothetical protein
LPSAYCTIYFSSHSITPLKKIIIVLPILTQIPPADHHLDE